MPLDTRRILFSEEEVIVAIRQFYDRKGKSFPIGIVENTTIIEKPECTFQCDIVRDNNQEQVVVAGAALAAALIAYCISRRIPLPAKADKTLAISQGQLVLAINMPIEHRTAVSPPRARQAV